MVATRVVRGTGVRRYTGAWLLLAFGISFSTTAYAGAGIWTSGGPYGGRIRALAINPVKPTTLYAGTDGDGVFKSTDSGRTWAAANKGLTSPSVSALAVNPSTPSTLYAGTFGGGVFKSTDAGGSWSAANTGLLNPQVGALAIDPANPATLYAGTFDYPYPGGVYKSTDSGGTWALASKGLTNLVIFALAVDPANSSTLYAGTDGSGVFKSTDAGGTWASASVGLTNGVVLALAINPAAPAALYAGTFASGGGWVFKSTDAGGTWSDVNPGFLVDVYALAIDPASPATVYAGSRFGVFKSTNSGGTWDVATGPTSYVFALAVDPASTATLYAGTYSGALKSTDGGATWTNASKGLARPEVRAVAIDPVTPSTLYAGTFASGVGIFKSVDSGETWAAADAGITDQGRNVSALAVNPSTPATLYAGTGHGVFKSTDSGQTWVRASDGLNLAEIAVLAISSSSPATLYAGTSGDGVFKSVDAGASWTSVNTGLKNPFIDALAIDPVIPSTLYVGTSLNFGAGRGIFKSTDSGGTWAEASTGLPLDDVLSLAVNPVNPATLYAGTSSNGVFKSTDSGGTWTAANAGLTTLGVSSIVIDRGAPATLYAATSTPYRGDAGVFKSTDGGVTWAPINAGLPLAGVNALALNPAGTTLYAALQGSWENGGVWQATLPTSSPTLLLPGTAHSPGLGGAFYTTDVTVSNVGAARASVTLRFLGNNRDGSSGPVKNFFLEPDTSATFHDVLGSVFGETDNFGAIRITSNTSPLDVVSVTSTPGFGGTFGQTLSAVSSSDLIPAGSARSILYIREGDGFRSNLILASSASDSTNVDVALVSPAGATLATKTYSVPPNGMTQINKVVRDMGVSGAVTGARLVLSSINPRAAFTAVASVIDETTNDPTAVIAQPPSAPGPGPFTWLLPSSAHSTGLSGAFYTTNVAVANVGAAPASFTMKFLGNNQDGSGGPEQTFDLEVGKSVTYFDVLRSVFNQTSDFGAIRITSSSSFLNIVSVTSTPGFGGTFGQSSPAVSSSDLIPAGPSRSILYIREGDGFRTNLILASNASTATTVDTALVSSAGTTLAARSYSVPPNGMTQINRIVRDMGVPGPITGARLVLSSSTPNAAFTGFASVIDETTNDPTAVQPQ